MNRINKALKRIWAIPLVRNAINTFWQAFLAVFVVGVPLVLAAENKGGLQAGEHAIIALLSASVAAGFSAAKTIVSAYYRTVKNK